VSTSQLLNAFSDPALPAGFAPFNIANICGHLYVAYAKQDAGNTDDVAGAGNGFINIFSYDGTLIRRLISNGPLNSPWALALAPEDFGQFSNKLLVGNFGNGRINVFDPATGNFLGELQWRQAHNSQANTIDGLWGLVAHCVSVYFAAGGNDELHGTVGKIKPYYKDC